MNLQELGYNEHFEKIRLENKLTDFEIGRIIAEHKERYIVKTENDEFECEITGAIRFTAKSREDFPAVGDWVTLITYDSSLAIIHNIFPRFSTISRQAVGQFGEKQIIATNVDYAFLVQSVDRDFNINRLERYLTICYSSKVNPIILLTKKDLITELQLSDIVERIHQRVKNIPVIAISNQTQSGIETLEKYIEKGKTYCMLGSSGVGKSSLLNNLSGKKIMKTDTISTSTNKGRHITSHRELIVLENGGVLIDNPGMREVGITDAGMGLETAFHTITIAAQNCKYKDCTHTNENNCAVLQALENGDIDKASYDNYQKMEREKVHFESSLYEKKQKDKGFGKMMKNYKKDMRRKGK